MLLANHSLLLVNIVSCWAFENHVAFKELPNMADKMCPVGEVDFQAAANNVLACSRLCADASSCSSFIYIDGNTTCFAIRSEFPFSSFSSLIGAVFYQPSKASATTAAPITAAATSATTATSTETSTFPTPTATTMTLPACASSTFPLSGLAKNKYSCSSELSKSFSPDQAYMYSGGCWSADNTSTSDQWIQVDLSTPTLVIEVSTKGNANANEWVTSYTVSYSTDCIDFQEVLDSDGQTRVFSGNYDRSTVVKHVLNPPAEGICFRLNPITFHGLISLRFDLLECNL